jgi:hypothetical protein
MRADRGDGPAIRLRQSKAALLTLRTDAVHVDHRTGRVVLLWLLISRERWLWGDWGSRRELNGMHG